MVVGVRIGVGTYDPGPEKGHVGPKEDFSGVPVVPTSLFPKIPLGTVK